jgi:hypothetical protein
MPRRKHPMQAHVVAKGIGAGKGPMANPNTHLQLRQKNIFTPRDLSCAYAVPVIAFLQWGQIGIIEFMFPPKRAIFK